MRNTNIWLSSPHHFPHYLHRPIWCKYIHWSKSTTPFLTTTCPPQCTLSFPPSTGQTTLATRITKYFNSFKIKTQLCAWQRDIIYTLLQQQYDENSGCVQIVGGDFNHQNSELVETNTPYN